MLKAMQEDLRSQGKWSAIWSEIVLGSYAGTFRGAHINFHPSPQMPAQLRTTFLSLCLIRAVSDQSTVLK